MEWSTSEVRTLKRAYKTIQAEAPPSLTKSQLWLQVATIVGSGRTARECHDKYRELGALRAKERAEGKDTEAKSLGSDSITSRLDACLISRPRSAAKRVDSFSSEAASDASLPSCSRSGPKGNGKMQGAVHGFGALAIADLPPAVSSRSWAPAGAKGGYADEGELVVDDIEEEDIDIEPARPNVTNRPTTACASAARATREAPPPVPYSSSVGRIEGSAAVRGEPLSAQTVPALRMLLFGDQSKSFNQAWVDQNFVFTKCQGLGFGLVQHKGGPCGVLGVVQAFVLARLLYDHGRCGQTANATTDWSDPRDAERKDVLAWALAHVLWKAGGGGVAVVALAGDASQPGIKADGITERVRTQSFRSEEATRDHIRSNLDRFTTRGAGGVVLFTYSVLLSRGLDAVQADADDAMGGRNMLIDRHGYASQELVNLLLVGRAHSNVFDGVQVLDDASGKADDFVRLRGIPARGLVGFLTLFEAYGHCKVGSHLKQPELPVWVVCSESHYSVLFAPPRQDVNAVRFDACYYDGLANQQELITLSINQQPKKAPPKGPDDHALIPPMDLVVRTRWPRAGVEWSCDPIL